MKERITCDLCGGTDFYNEAGNYYCSGCQTQTQEMQEHEFATEQTFTKTRIEKKKRADKTRKVTSWEYYNYILLGLSEELIDLGAEETLKPIVMFLWMHYLKQLQVISRDKNALPKIQLLNSAVDAEIIYGKPVSTFKRKRKVSSSSGSTMVTTSAHARRMRKSKSLKALERSQSEARSEAQQSEEDQYSLHNETLSSLKSNVSDAANQNRRAIYNSSSSKELLKHQSREHLRKHQEDYDKKLKCHKISYLTVSTPYRMGAHNLSLNKIYSIIYLALLINGDKIGLAEMLRFIKEGHLSFNRYDHFFPENYLGTNKLFGTSQRNVELMNEQFRVAVARVGNLLKVTGFVPQQNFLQLCEKYCKELNLPDEIHQYAKNILITLKPRMLFTAKSSTIPNYEARVLSIILIILKLIFCLDGKTEYEFSNFANDVNSRLKNPHRMFDIIAWLKYIEYRKIVLTEHNFAAKFDNDKNFSESGLFVQFLQQEKPDDDVIPKNLEKIHHLLTILENNTKRKQSNLSFPHTLTPFYDYTRIIVDEGVIEENGYLENVLNKDFVDDSLEFLMKPKKYLELVAGNREVEIISGGANENFVFEPVINCVNFKKTLTYFYNQKMLVNLNTTLTEDKNMSHIKVPDYDPTVRDTKTILRSYNSLHAKKFEKNKTKLTAKTDGVDMNVDFELSDVDNLNKNLGLKHFLPCERYWVKYRLHCWNEKEFEDFLSTLPTTFLVVLKDCARICEQSLKQFYEEFQLTEIYIIYCSGLRQNEKVLAQPLKTLIERAKSNW